MVNFLGATFHLAESELFPGERKCIILSEHSLNVAPPVAIESETHTNFVKELYCVSRKPAFVRAVHLQTTFIPWLSQRTFTVVFIPTPTVKLKEISYSGGCDEHFARSIAAPPGLVSSFQSAPPPRGVRLKGETIFPVRSFDHSDFPAGRLPSAEQSGQMAGCWSFLLVHPPEPPQRQVLWLVTGRRGLVLVPPHRDVANIEYAPWDAKRGCSVGQC